MNHSINQSMLQRSFQIVFQTPTFLGDAKQSGRWRTPPLKAQLRQWWRVWYASNAAKPDVNIEAMRQAEGKLFGNTWLDNDFCKSSVRIRLSQWREGRLENGDWTRGDIVKHSEVDRSGGLIDGHLYLGYGPVTGDGLKKNNAAIQAREIALLDIAYPADKAQGIEQALQLMHLYGTVGGRSRNGWGSYGFEMAGSDGELPLLNALTDSTTHSAIKPFLKHWQDCLSLDWPHAIGQDKQGPLIWHTNPHDDWRSLFTSLARIKIALRTMFKFPQEKQNGKVHERHWLSYPITNHEVNEWDRKTTGRLPNSLRFKVRETPNGKLIGVIFHVPHLPPAAFKPNVEEIKWVWEKVHTHLDTSYTGKSNNQYPHDANKQPLILLARQGI